MGRTQKQGPEAVLPTAPAYSFGSVPSPPLTGDTGPGPGAYFTQQLVRRPGGFSVLSEGASAPAVTICARPADARGSAASPGPGDYEPRDCLVRRSSPQFTIKGVDPKDSRARYPSVGHYSPERGDRLQHPSQPAVAICLKHPPPESYERRPAPGEYEVSAASAARARSPPPVTLKFRRDPPASQRPGSGHAVPGPGEYALRGTMVGPRYSFGKRLHYKEAPPPSSGGSGGGRGGGGGSGDSSARGRPASASPGPGSYEVHHSTIGLAGRLARRAATPVD